MTMITRRGFFGGLVAAVAAVVVAPKVLLGKMRSKPDQTFEVGTRTWPDWTGGGNLSDFDDPRNWAGGRAPGCGDVARFPAKPQQIDSWTFDKDSLGQETVTIRRAGEEVGHSHVLAPGDRLDVTFNPPTHWRHCAG